MKYRECKIQIPKKIYDEFEEFVLQLPIEGYYEILFDPENPKSHKEGIISDNTRLSVYLKEDDLHTELKIFVFLKIHSLDDFFLESKIIETKDYEESYKEFYTPFEIGRYFIIPTWEKSKNANTPSSSIPLFLNPGMAFGTGHHETTKLMLNRMSSLNFTEKSILDIGTGSGILSIGAALLGAKFVTALDIDPNSIRAAEYNWNENAIPPNVRFELYEGGFDHKMAQEKKYDFLLTNITYSVISNNIDFISSIQTDHFLFSGVITEKRDLAIELFSKNLGGKLLYEDKLNDWVIIEWSK
ncbi:MAG: 50S ribosomal protein L11 methyltransferase [Leptospiraceae bacterium]|nr:50S ribosomal protein L11 methyltransferase [Leptospiraceae bacterium]MCK6379701.1 50S ribosomal protein L11 methyltransferase [Leptospiraceae bacterium]NUM40505.1 50S ribosomal protein L11 methyltransferase [Leptospiraceae bacterium]